MQYKIIVDKQPSPNPSSEIKEYIIDIEELRVKGDIYDSLVITKGEDYVIRRLELTKYHKLNVLDEPIKEPLNDLNIELFEGDNYIYLMDMSGNKFYAEYIVKNDFTDIYVTNSEMNSAINQTAKEIEVSVNQKLTGYSTTEEMNSSINAKANEINAKVEKKVDEETITGAYLILKINGDTSEAKLKADKIELTANDILNLIAGNEINLTSKNMTITATNFSVDKNGNIVAIGGKIGGFNLSSTELSGNLDGTYNYDKFDAIIALCSYVYDMELGITERDILDVNGDGTVDTFDGQKIQLHVNGNTPITKNIKGTFKINSKDPKNILTIKNSYGEKTVSLGVLGIDTNIISAKNIICSNKSTSTTAPISIISPSGITTPVVTQTSLKSKKKNIKRLRINALDLIKNSDIYLYNLKGEKAKSKKHIGLVIGEGYNCPEEVISEDGQGIEQYSMTSLAWKAIQEQQEIIEKLNKRIEQLEAK